jgi:hypothetical protein
MAKQRQPVVRHYRIPSGIDVTKSIDNGRRQRASDAD